MQMYGFGFITFLFITIVIFIIIFSLWSVLHVKKPDTPELFDKLSDFEDANKEPEETDPPEKMTEAEWETDSFGFHQAEPFQSETPVKTRIIRKTYVLRRTLHSNPSAADFLLSEHVTER